MEISNNYDTAKAFVSNQANQANQPEAVEHQAAAKATEVGAVAPAPEEAVAPGAKLESMKSALLSAGLKPSEENLKVVSLLIENKMPVNKENVLTLSRAVSFAGYESTKKAVLLMKNDVPATLASMEKLDAFVKDGAKLLNQLETLANNIMSMEPGPAKQKLLKAFEQGAFKQGQTSDKLLPGQTTLEPAIEKGVPLSRVQGEYNPKTAQGPVLPGQSQTQGPVSLSQGQPQNAAVFSQGQPQNTVGLSQGQPQSTAGMSNQGQSQGAAVQSQGQPQDSANIRATMPGIQNAAEKSGIVNLMPNSQGESPTAGKNEALGHGGKTIVNNGEAVINSQTIIEANKGIIENAQMPLGLNNGETRGLGSENRAATAENASQLNQNETPLDKIKTGTAFFREVFAETNKSHNMKQPLGKTEKEYVAANLERIKPEFTRLTENGELKKDDITKLLKSMPDSEKIAEALNNEDKLKRLIFTISEESNLAREHVAKAKAFKGAIAKGAKAIVNKLSLDADKDNIELEEAQENLREKLTQIAKNVENTEETKAVRKSLGEAKDNLTFLNRFKNDVIVNYPIILNQQQKHAELYVFADRQKKSGKSNRSQSALISLNLANLGLFETYLQKTGNDVTCQFRLKDQEIEKLVGAHIEQLEAGLRAKGYALNAFSFKQVGDKFDVLDGEPSESVTADFNAAFDRRT